MPKWINNGNKYDNNEEKIITRFLLLPKALPICETDNEDVTCETRWLCVASFKRRYGYKFGGFDDPYVKTHYDICWE